MNTSAMGWMRLLSVVLAATVPGSSSEPEANLPDVTAWTSVGRANIRAEPDAQSPLVGFVEREDAVQVKTCLPSCTTPQGWALLNPFGAIRLSSLTFIPPSEAVPRPDAFLYGRVGPPGATVRTEPSFSGRILSVHPRGHVLALLPGSEEAGWLRVVRGGYVPSSELRLLTPSPFTGISMPPAAVALTVRTTAAAPRLRGFAALGEGRGSVVIPGRRIPRSAVRLAVARPRPLGVPSTARWVHVDLNEQVLTAYEGNTLVYATLVSTGKPGWETPQGLFKVWLKVKHNDMNGTIEPYHVEEVPSAMFFHRGVALHGAAWHDHFGTRVSHGCVNLSPKDAAWLFAWAPPHLPEGWHGLYTDPAGLTALWVQVEKAGKPVLKHLEKTIPAPVLTSLR